MSLRMSHTCPIKKGYVSLYDFLRVPLRLFTCPFTKLYVSHTSPTPYVPTCPVRVPYVSRTCPIRVPYVSHTSRKPTRSTRVADALEEQEQSDSEGPAVKKYRTSAQVA